MIPVCCKIALRLQARGVPCPVACVRVPNCIDKHSRLQWKGKKMTDTRPNVGALDRRSFLRVGLLGSAGVAAIGVASAYGTNTALAATAGVQQGWRWCSVCNQLFYASGGIPPFSCMGAAPHTPGPTDYSLDHDLDLSGITNMQGGWRYCSACKVLFWGSALASTLCPENPNPNGGFLRHVLNSATSVYDLFLTSGTSLQGGWNYCTWCHDLYHGSGHPAGQCMVNTAQNGHGAILEHEPFSAGTNYYVPLGG